MANATPYGYRVRQMPTEEPVLREGNPGAGIWRWKPSSSTGLT
ncbi:MULTISPECIES: hypothetical protein [Brasilonema]|nr:MULTISPECIES: hypothetical protein [Brasilonema]